MQANKALAGALKRLRAEQGLSQAALAEQTGLSVQFIAALEQRRKEPSLATLDVLSRALGVTVAELFVPDSRMPRQGYAAEISTMVESLDAAQRERLLVIVREAHALATAPRARGRRQ